MSNVAEVKRWISKDEKEAIIILSGEYWLVHIETKSSKMIGRSIEEAREILKELDKYNDFIDL